MLQITVTDLIEIICAYYRISLQKTKMHHQLTQTIIVVIIFYIFQTKQNHNFNSLVRWFWLIMFEHGFAMKLSPVIHLW